MTGWNRQAWRKQRYEMMRARAFEFLGGKCAECGGTDRLEIDHVNRTSKSFDMSGMTCLSWDRIEAELQKCQLLCRLHHEAKTLRENSVPHGGGKGGKRKCMCGPCRDQRRIYQRDLMRARRAKAKLIDARLAQLVRAPT
ncbi:hypothetical protein [Mycobacteroides abscessus]|uniref:hypothetical protein n=1 Tax=Mycobacteroides abscessus TaxID=36809 RepID=UPI0010422A2C|nr:hypothetical protein [Mycobacteroides abscessus]